MYSFLYQGVFSLAFLNFLVFWTDLFFSTSLLKSSKNYLISLKNVKQKLFTRSSFQLVKTGKTHRNFPYAENLDSPTEQIRDEEVKSGARPLAKPWSQPTGLSPEKQKKILTPESIDSKGFKIFGNHPFEMLEFFTSIILWFFLTLLLFFRYLKSNHFPLANFYEALIFLTWCLVTLNFFLIFGINSNESLEDKRPIEIKSSFSSHGLPRGSHEMNPRGMPFSKSFKFRWRSKKNELNRINSKKKILNILSKPQKKIFGGILAPCILFIIAFAQFNLSSEFSPLVPALKSNWLLMHVSIMIFSYTIFISAGLVSLILVIQKFWNKLQFFNAWAYKQS